ncbi:hypothetical protein AHAS_Ahas13G0274800 [Arachis hypogaea]
MSNLSEVTMARAVMIRCIMLKNEVVVERVIPQEIYSIAPNASTNAKLVFPHLIYRLCDAARVRINHDILISIERPISKKTMDYARAPREEPVPAPQPEQPAMPKGHYFPLQEYW